ncbi:MAG: hypothetical protein DRQ88_07350 [Epsilonproteobacteria bacterium]|nr:MAG: hypothetical protein DRQ89_07785 [Campylobacterota bacterium]RLA66215.1 MAG: hypothetical protein DRQ88_07350 [Campylobacterota bacterium]
MNYSALLIGIIPLLIFVLVDTFAGLKVALISTVAMALLEGVFSFYYFGEIDSVTIFSLFSVVLFCYISFRKKDPLFIKLQPAILSLVMGLVLIISFSIHEPLLLNLATKYKELYPPEFQLQFANPHFLKLLEISTFSMGLGLLAHALVTALAAFKLSNWWWLAVRGVGFYFFVGLSLVIQKSFI